MKFVGFLLILNSIVITAWWVTSHGTHKGAVLTLCTLAVFAGLATVLSDRITELSLQGVGTIKTAAKQAQTDAETVAGLKARVENQSATVDLVAQQAKKAETLSEEVAEKSLRADEKLRTLDQAIAKAHTTLNELEIVTEYTKTVVAAQNDDRKAFDKLKQWSEDKTHPFANEAGKAWTVILDSHFKMMRLGGFNIPWNEGIDPSTLTLSQLDEQYRELHSQMKPAFLEYIWQRNDISQVDRLDFLMKIMETDENLTAVEYAGYHFTDGTKQKIKPLAVEYLSKWWKEHRHEFVEKESNKLDAGDGK